MKYSVNKAKSPSENKDDCLVVPIFCETQKNKKKAVLHDAAQQLDEASKGAISDFIKTGDFTGKANQTQMLYQLEGISASRVLLVGCGDQKEFNIKALNGATQAASKAVKDSEIKSLSFYLADSFSSNDTANERNDETENAVTQIIIAHADSIYELNDYKSESKPDSKLKSVSIATSSDTEFKTAVKNGAAIGEGMKLSRDLANHPGNVCTPTFIADTAKDVAKEFSSVSLNILEEKDMEKLGMGAFLSVSKGSDEPGKMIILEYHGVKNSSAKNKTEAPVALVGKGVTFDTGGISLKAGASMDEMKFDMSGAAGMLGTLKACAEMELPINLVVILAAAENMPSGRATKPGDIVTSMSGKTIEVLNTDAEGRLVLCDALTYVDKFKPAVVIDAATLTGACIVALGHHICAVLSNDEKLTSDLINAGNTINDRAWQLPMGDDYKQQLESAFADLGNIGGKGAGTITAACFLGEFTKDYKWAHLDIAGTAWTGKNSTGRPVPLLSQYLINYAKS